VITCVNCLFLCLFFFSSRRRHTSSKRDWSSDVCSSDLRIFFSFAIGVEPGDAILPVCPFTPMANEKKILAKSWDNRYGCGLSIRSEERRVGKECISERVG